MKRKTIVDQFFLRLYIVLPTVYPFYDTGELSLLKEKKFQNWAYWHYAYLLCVVLFGAYVRATGAGAGCGSHWPLCDGQVIPRTFFHERLIEYSHRVSSGLSLFFTCAMYIYSLKIFPKFHLARKMAKYCLIFIIIEALLGGALVLLNHVADNPSLYRGVSISLHLINTFLLMASATGLIFFSTVENSNFSLFRHKYFLLFFFGFVCLLFSSTSGAITALGDTLFPVASVSEAFMKSFDFKHHLWVTVRIYHPFLAIFSSIYIFLSVRKVSQVSQCFKQAICFVYFCLFFQLSLGFLNVFFHAPVVLQILHLFLAHFLWAGYVLVYLNSHLYLSSLSSFSFGKSVVR